MWRRCGHGNAADVSLSSASESSVTLSLAVSLALLPHNPFPQLASSAFVSGPR